jgi:Ni,Fe-hydrogenase I cytochrome b subunit
MEPDERKMLERLLHLSEHNNRILRHIRREMLFHRFARLFYWILILAVSIAGYYYVKPYIENAITTIESAALERGLGQ